MNVVTRGMRNATRNTTRTISIVVIVGLSIGLSLSMLLAYQAVGQKIDSVTSSVGNTVSVSPAGVRGFDGGGNALTEAELAPVAKIDHVTSVTMSLSDRLTTSNSSLTSAVDAGSLGQRFAQNNGQVSAPPMGETSNPDASNRTVSFTPPVTVNGTTDPTDLSSGFGGGGTFTLKSGKVFESGSTENVAIVGTSLATKNNLKVGSTFTAYDTTITVIGVFDSGNTFSNNQIIMPLASVQALSDQAGAVTSATVNVDSIENVASVTTAVQKELGSTADVTNASTRAQTAIAPLKNIQSISLYSLIGAIVAGSVIILLTMIMIVRERRREIGVIKAIGASNRTIMAQFTSEALTLTTLGAIVGIVLGILAANPITNMLVTNSTSTATGAGPGRGFGIVRNNLSSIHAAVGWSVVLYGIAAALIIAIVGSGIASYFVAKVRPSEVMRTE